MLNPVRVRLELSLKHPEALHPAGRPVEAGGAGAAEEEATVEEGVEDLTVVGTRTTEVAEEECDEDMLMAMEVEETTLDEDTATEEDVTEGVDEDTATEEEAGVLPGVGLKRRVRR